MGARALQGFAARRDPAGPGLPAGQRSDPAGRDGRGDHRAPGPARGRRGPRGARADRLAAGPEPLRGDRDDVDAPGRPDPLARDPGRRTGRGAGPAARPGAAGDRAERRHRPDRRLRGRAESGELGPIAGPRPSGGPARGPDRPAGRGAAGDLRARSPRSASRMAWSRSCGSRRSGSGRGSSRSVRPSRGPSTNAIGSGSRRIRSFPARSPTRSHRCPIRPRSGWRWPDASGWSSRTNRVSGSWPPRPDSGPTTRSTSPQMVATSWLTLRTWHEPDGAPGDASGTDSELAVPYLRPAALLWLATLGDAEWVALDDLAGHLTARYAGMGSPEPVRPAGRRRVGRQGAARGARHDDAPRPAPHRAAARSGPARGRDGAARARGAGVDLAGRRVSPRAGPCRRGAGDRPSRRAIDPAGAVRPGVRSDAPAPPHIRPVPLRPAELRDDRLSTGADAPPRGAAQPIRPVVAGRFRARAEADA